MTTKEKQLEEENKNLKKMNETLKDQITIALEKISELKYGL